MKVVPYEVAQSVQQLVYQSCEAMNQEVWSDYLRLCDPEKFQYRVVTYTPEIRREQLWADRDFKSMKSAFGLLPRHNSDHSKLTRHSTVQSIKYDPDTREAEAASSLTIYRTQVDGTMSYLDSGQTSLYAVGSYHDRILMSEQGPVLIERTVRLETRQLDVGSHKPF
jgi:methanesulfonate monooxygenase subunit beta